MKQRASVPSELGLSLGINPSNRIVIPVDLNSIEAEMTLPTPVYSSMRAYMYTYTYTYTYIYID